MCLKLSSSSLSMAGALACTALCLSPRVQADVFGCSFTVCACPADAAEIYVSVTNGAMSQTKVCVITVCPDGSKEEDWFIKDSATSGSVPFACDKCIGGIQPDFAWGFVGDCGDFLDPVWTVEC